MVNMLILKYISVVRDLIKLLYGRTGFLGSLEQYVG